MSAVVEFFIGDTGRNWVIQLVDSAGVAINVTGWTAKLQAKSPDIATTIDLAGTIFDATAGKFSFAAPGNQITIAQAGTRKAVSFSCQVRAVDGSAKVRYSSTFPLQLTKPLL